MKIQFKQTSKSPSSIQIILDDKDITSSVRSFKFSADADSISTVLLEVFPDNIEIESEEIKLSTEHFTLNDMLNAMMNEGAEYAKKKIKRELFEKM